MKTFKLFLLQLLIFTSIEAQQVNDFTLKSVTDNSSFTLSSAKGKYVALHFLLKTECPYCIRHTNEYIENEKSLPNVIQIFIKPDNENEIKEWLNKLTKNDLSNYKIYQDANAQLATRFQIPDGYAFHGQSVHYPALILINTEGKEVFRYVGKGNNDRYSFAKLKLKIQELSNPSNNE